MTRRSISGYCVFVNKNLVSWKSKKQPTLFKSSTEADYRAMAATTCEAMWIVKILKDLGLKYLLPVELHCDNKAAIQIAANPVMHEKTKHFDLDVHFVREKVASGLIKTVKVDTKCQVADIFTKALGSFQHNVLVKTTLSVSQDSKFHSCDNSANFTTNSVYQRNLDNALSSLTSDTSTRSGFYNDSVGQNPDEANVIGLCKGDVEPDDCRSHPGTTIATTTTNTFISTTTAAIRVIESYTYGVNKKKKKDPSTSARELSCDIILAYEDGEIDESSIADSLQYSFDIIKEATDDFSENNKLGQGGFGLVYKRKPLSTPPHALWMSSSS
ncbi:ribonuclease H-like domain-containing protein [Tanacetum coccineum]